MNKPLLPIGIGLGRLAFGVIGYLAPPTIARLGPLPGLDNPDGAYMTRHWAIRDAAIGVLTLVPATRRLGLLFGAAVDTGDAVTGILAARGGSSPRAAVATVGGAGAFAVAGFAGLRHPTDHDA
jgi:hypothetical protein